MGEPTSSDRFVRAFDRPFVITASLLSSAALLRWEFIKEHEKLRKQENTISTKKAIKKKRKKTRSQPRKRPRKKKNLFLFFLLSCFLFLVIACRNHRYKYEYKYEN